MASTSQRRRQLARQRWEKQQARRAAAAARARRRRRALVVLVVVMLVVASVAAAVVWWPWAGDDATTAQETPAPTSAAADGTCTYTETGTEELVAGLPPETPTSATTATLTVGGKPVSVELLAEAAPCTVNSFAHLATNGYFDGTTCHRLTTSDTLKVLQCGDPTGSGNGGPGYQFGVENSEGATYPAGTVAMARGEDPGSNGSQFFIVYGDSQLPPTPGYTVFGRVTEGLDVIGQIATLGTADGSTDAAPKTPVTLDEVVTA